MLNSSCVFDARATLFAFETLRQKKLDQQAKECTSNLSEMDEIRGLLTGLIERVNTLSADSLMQGQRILKAQVSIHESIKACATTEDLKRAHHDIKHTSRQVADLRTLVNENLALDKDVSKEIDDKLSTLVGTVQNLAVDKDVSKGTDEKLSTLIGTVQNLADEKDVSKGIDDKLSTLISTVQNLADDKDVSKATKDIDSKLTSILDKIPSLALESDVSLATTHISNVIHPLTQIASTICVKEDLKDIATSPAFRDIANKVANIDSRLPDIARGSDVSMVTTHIDTVIHPLAQMASSICTKEDLKGTASLKAVEDINSSLSQIIALLPNEKSQLCVRDDLRNIATHQDLRVINSNITRVISFLPDKVSKFCVQDDLKVIDNNIARVISFLPDKVSKLCVRDDLKDVARSQHIKGIDDKIARVTAFLPDKVSKFCIKEDLEEIVKYKDLRRIDDNLAKVVSFLPEELSIRQDLNVLLNGFGALRRSVDDLIFDTSYLVTSNFTMTRVVMQLCDDAMQLRDDVKAADCRLTALTRSQVLMSCIGLGIYYETGTHFHDQKRNAFALVTELAIIGEKVKSFETTTVARLEGVDEWMRTISKDVVVFNENTKSFETTTADQLTGMDKWMDTISKEVVLLGEKVKSLEITTADQLTGVDKWMDTLSKDVVIFNKNTKSFKTTTSAQLKSVDMWMDSISRTIANQSTGIWIAALFNESQFVRMRSTMFHLHQQVPTISSLISSLRSELRSNNAAVTDIIKDSVNSMLLDHLATREDVWKLNQAFQTAPYIATMSHKLEELKSSFKTQSEDCIKVVTTIKNDITSARIAPRPRASDSRSEEFSNGSSQESSSLFSASSNTTYTRTNSPTLTHGVHLPPSHVSYSRLGSYIGEGSHNKRPLSQFRAPTPGEQLQSATPDPKRLQSERHAKNIGVGAVLEEEQPQRPRSDIDFGHPPPRISTVLQTSSVPISSRRDLGFVLTSTTHPDSSASDLGDPFRSNSGHMGPPQTPGRTVNPTSRWRRYHVGMPQDESSLSQAGLPADVVEMIRSRENKASGSRPFLWSHNHGRRRRCWASQYNTNKDWKILIQPPRLQGRQDRQTDEKIQGYRTWWEDHWEDPEDECDHCKWCREKGVTRVYCFTFVDEETLELFVPEDKEKCSLPNGTPYQFYSQVQSPSFFSNVEP